MLNSDQVLERSPRQVDAPATDVTPSPFQGAMQALGPGVLQRKILRRSAERAGVVQRHQGGAGLGEHEPNLDGATAPAQEGSFQSNRFGKDAKLDAAHDDSRPVRSGDTGMAVKKLQQALIDLGYLLPAFGVDGIFGSETAAAVKAFQHKEGLTENSEAGKETMDRLDLRYRSFKPYVDLAHTQTQGLPPPGDTEIAVDKTPKAYLAGTRHLDAADKKAIDEAISSTPQIDPKTGKPPKFEPDIAKGNYRVRLRTELEADLLREHAKLGAGKQAQHDDPSQLHDWKGIEDVANLSKQQTDGVYGGYAQRPPLKRGLNLKDAWDDKSQKIAVMTDDQKMDVARWRVEKIIRSYDSVHDINVEHGVIRTRDPEKTVIAEVTEELATKHKDKLLETHKGWSAYADPSTHSVFLQRFKSSDADQNRTYMWRQFQTLIHEYIHTLAHSKYSAYADKLPSDKGHTLREGMTEFLAHNVLSTVNYGDPALRKGVEGPYHDPAAATPVPKYTGYSERANAEAMVAVCGARNAYGAYFLGHTELIGGP